MASTYELIETTTLSSSASSVTFSSITQDYRDLVLVINHSTSATVAFRSYLNSDSGSNYNYVYMRGDGSPAASASAGSSVVALAGRSTANKGMSVIQYLDYSATDKHKTFLVRTDDASYATEAVATRWANTSAITNIEVTAVTQTFDSGSTFSLYGIAS